MTNGLTASKNNAPARGHYQGETMNKDIEDIIADIMIEAEEGDDVERRILETLEEALNEMEKLYE